MGEVSGDSSSPLLQIPSPISQAQRAGLHCQAPTQLCYLSLSHTHTNTLRQAHKTDTLIPTVAWLCFFSPSSFPAFLSHSQIKILKQKTNYCTYFFCPPSSPCHTNAQCQMLWLSGTHTFWQVESFSFLSVCLHPYIFHIEEYTQRNSTNHLQVCSISDVLRQHANLLLFNNQACFELLFPLVPLAQRSVHHAEGKIGELQSISRTSCSPIHYFIINGK